MATNNEKNDQNKDDLESFDSIETFGEAVEKEFGSIMAAWEFPEFEKHARGKWWYISLIVITIALLTYSYFANNPLFALIILFFLVIYFATDKKNPDNVEFVLTEDGVLIHGKFIEYESFRNFYILYYPPHIKSLYLQPKNELKQLINIPLQNQNPVAIRKILLKYMEEDLEKEEIPNSEGISRLLKL